MVHVIVRHKVSDYSHWKETFDAFLTARMHAGELGCRLFQNVDDPRDVTVLTDWDSLEQARKFLGSDEVRTAMQKGGVVGTPEIQFVQDVRMVRRTAAD